MKYFHGDETFERKPNGIGWFLLYGQIPCHGITFSAKNREYSTTDLRNIAGIL